MFRAHKKKWTSDAHCVCVNLRNSSESTGYIAHVSRWQVFDGSNFGYPYGKYMEIRLSMFSVRRELR